MCATEASLLSASPRLRLANHGGRLHRLASAATRPLLALLLLAGGLAGCALGIPSGMAAERGTSVVGKTSKAGDPFYDAALALLLRASKPALVGLWSRARLMLASFSFVPGETALSRPRAPALAVLAYLASIAACKRLAARGAAPMQDALQAAVVVHNVLLAAWSALLLCGLAVAVGAAVASSGGVAAGVFRVWCDPQPHQLSSSNLVGLFYLNYVTKYLELFDTLLLALRGRPTPALHVFHHSATLLLCWVQLTDDTACQVVPIFLNLAVHVFMYGYYALASIGVRPWWKRHLTAVQITQFAVDVPSCVAALTLRVNAENGWGWFGGAATHCRGTHRAAYVGIGLLATYLALFVQLYAQAYGRRSSKSKKEA